MFPAVLAEKTDSVRGLEVDSEGEGESGKCRLRAERSKVLVLLLLLGFGEVRGAVGAILCEEVVVEEMSR